MKTKLFLAFGALVVSMNLALIAVAQEKEKEPTSASPLIRPQLSLPNPGQDLGEQSSEKSAPSIIGKSVDLNPNLSVTPDDISDQLRNANQPITKQDRLGLAKSLADREITGIGAPTFLEFDKLQLSVDLKLDASINGAVTLHRGEGLSLFPVLYSDYSVLGLELKLPVRQPPEYYLVEVHLKAFSSTCDDSGQGKLSVEHMLNGRATSSEAWVKEDFQVASIIVDATTTADSGEIEVPLRGNCVTIKAVEVRPLR